MTDEKRQCRLEPVNVSWCKFTVAIFVKEIHVLELEYMSNRKTNETLLNWPLQSRQENSSSMKIERFGHRQNR